MEQEPEAMPGADEELAGLIVRDLVAAGLVDGGVAALVQRKLAAGSARRDDWLAWLDVPSPAAERGTRCRTA